MTRENQDAVKSAACPECFGRWMPMAALMRRFRLDLENNAGSGDPLPDESAAPLADLAEMAKACNSSGVLHCPECEKALTKQKFHPMIPVQIDRCKPCASLWLDAGEYVLLRRLQQALATSEEPEIIARRKKFSASSGSWDAQANSKSYTGVAPGETAAGFERDGFDFLAFLLERL
jgi:Zn-finger nucleic acid-binding protein